MKMQQRTIKLWAALFTLVLVSCTKYLDFEGEGATPRLVMNGLMYADSVFVVHLSNSVGYVDNLSIEKLTNGEVQVFNAEGNLIETLFHDGDGRYIGTQTAQAGQRYTITAEHAGFGSITANDRIPSPVTITSVDTFSVASSGNTEFGTYSLHVSFTIDDPAATENYYSVEALQYEDYYIEYVFNPDLNTFEPDTIWIDNPAYFRMSMVTTDPILINETPTGIAETEAFGNIFLFTDAVFNGSSRTITFRMENYNPGSDYVIRLSSLSHDFFRYQRTLDRYDYSNGDPFAEPVLIFTNVSGGLGILGGTSLFDFLIE